MVRSKFKDEHPFGPSPFPPFNVRRDDGAFQEGVTDPDDDDDEPASLALPSPSLGGTAPALARVWLAA